ncbi:hypothetical protein ACR8AL_06720 [Clavibacter sepedonicus]|nr:MULTISPECIES: hypothetical protein [Clavibacter]UUK66413.1 hypothetical protein LRE50_04115 [Clavibacter sepedonicus]
MAPATCSTLLGSAACAALALTLLGSAGAATAATARPADILQHVIPSSSASAAATGWTTARMHAAVPSAFVDDDPVDGDPPTTDEDVPAALDTSAVSADAALPSAAETIPVPGFSANDHLGVVFFRSGGVDQRSTGNVVVSASGDLVTTSGRSVSALKGAFVTDLVFVPQYDGTAPKGIWPATVVTVKSQWVTDRAVDFDTAFFRVQAPAGSAAGTTLSSVVGASGVRFAGQQDDEDYRSTGYALDGGHDGTKPVSVESSVEPNPWMNKDYAIEGIETELRAGISGSPWVNTDDDSGDVQRGMTTFAYKRFTHAAFGPQWTGALHAVFQVAAAS